MLIGDKFNSIEIAKIYNLKDFILFNCTVPYELKIDIDVYATRIRDILSKKLNKVELLRQVVFAVTKRCIEIRKDYYLGYINLGVVYLNQREYDKAYKYLMLALEKDNDNKKTLENLDILYINYAMNKGTHIEEAKKSIVRLLSKKPNDEKYLEVQKRLFGK